jgi:hypothetical protein
MAQKKLRAILYKHRQYLAMQSFAYYDMYQVVVTIRSWTFSVKSRNGHVNIGLNPKTLYKHDCGVQLFAVFVQISLAFYLLNNTIQSETQMHGNCAYRRMIKWR